MDIPFKLDLDPEKINAFVSEAIIKSAIGAELKRVITEQVSTLSRTFQNPIEGVVRREIETIVTQLIRTEYREKIAAVVREKVTEQFTDELLKKLWEAFNR